MIYCLHQSLLNHFVPAKIIDGKAIALSLREKIKQQVINRINRGRRAPGLAVILVGENPASEVYVAHKHAACEEVGFLSKNYRLSAQCSENELLMLIDQLNQDNTIDGILVQLPLPQQIDSSKVIDRINPTKDVDGFHPYNIGLLLQHRAQLRPCTAKGVALMIEHVLGKNIQGKHAVVVGDSNIVGRPTAIETLLEGCTVTICHKHTKNLPQFSRQADILIVAIGQPKYIQAEWIKPGATVIDVGINRLSNNKLVGDVNFDAAKDVAHWISPVPGGVGPMTVACLLENTLLAAELH